MLIGTYDKKAEMPCRDATQQKVSVSRLRRGTRDIHAGDGFIAWPGAAVDGRQYVKSALQKGATACLVEHAELEAKGYDWVTEPQTANV